MVSSCSIHWPWADGSMVGRKITPTLITVYSYITQRSASLWNLDGFVACATCVAPKYKSITKPRKQRGFPIIPATPMIRLGQGSREAYCIRNNMQSKSNRTSSGIPMLKQDITIREPINMQMGQSHHLPPPPHPAPRPRHTRTFERWTYDGPHLHHGSIVSALP